MSPELLLFLVVFVMPGAAMVFAWDMIGHRRQRTHLSFYGWGLFGSICAFALIQAGGFIDLSQLLNEKDSLSLKQMLLFQNLLLFLAIVVVGMAASGLASRAFHGRKVQGWLAKRSGGTTYRESTWHEVVDHAVNCWVRVEAKDGRVWQGWVERVSMDYDGGFLLLGEHPICWVDGEEHQAGAQYVAMPLSEITLFLLNQKEPADGQPDEDRPATTTADPAGGDQQGQSGLHGETIDAPTAQPATTEAQAVDN